ncbi:MULTISPECIES: hypothetical protein [Xanthomonas]|uniref:Uncharacterized protein n=7 Tax=Xanthomonas TaxID=338 RepID=A0A6V7FHX5_9XANT|nr:MULTISPECIES: hypothetical protein [Xanthomonas]MEB1846180.1 hypothetical protein [Xanthomonas campestris pv. campestris]EGD10781.1 hypothetical protein XVE_0836 [Xanthomonas vesicatoria ATCC 35937]MCC8499997.1 hypothetical protein [Xanthomonas hortorum pv. gardneri]MCC8506891.1 hypothetical protein [Xanthomonas hortorum pv. gardneri]MCC8520947.1 hypothetical protein [Xanthomonas hortorum pv. gardneri]
MEMPIVPDDQLAALVDTIPTKFTYTPWRDGGWYVPSIRYANGAIGCVSRNYPDKRWRVVCDPRGDAAPTYKSRHQAAAAECLLAALDRCKAAPGNG